MFNLKDKTIIITGGAGLIGSAFSKACVENQAKVVIVDIAEKKGKKMAEKIKRETKNKNVIFQECDITDSNNIKKLIDIVIKKYGRIDALVNSAYPKDKNFGRKFEDVEYQDFCQNINLHLGGYFLITQQIAKIMIRQNYGNIINLASIYGFSPPKFEIYKGTEMTVPIEYAAVKGAIITLTRYLASYLAKYNIRVNVISPGGVFDGQPEQFVKRYCRQVILGKRMAKLDDITGVLLFLLSDASQYITGQNIVVDGGFTLS